MNNNFEEKKVLAFARECIEASLVIGTFDDDKQQNEAAQALVDRVKEFVVDYNRDHDRKLIERIKGEVGQWFERMEDLAICGNYGLFFTGDGSHPTIYS